MQLTIWFNIPTRLRKWASGVDKLRTRWEDQELAAEDAAKAGDAKAGDAKAPTDAKAADAKAPAKPNP